MNGNEALKEARTFKNAGYAAFASSHYFRDISIEDITEDSRQDDRMPADITADGMQNGLFDRDSAHLHCDFHHNIMFEEGKVHLCPRFSPTNLTELNEGYPHTFADTQIITNFDRFGYDGFESNANELIESRDQFYSCSVDLESAESIYKQIPDEAYETALLHRNFAWSQDSLDETNKEISRERQTGLFRSDSPARCLWAERL